GRTAISRPAGGATLRDGREPRRIPTRQPRPARITANRARPAAGRSEQRQPEAKPAAVRQVQQRLVGDVEASGDGCAPGLLRDRGVACSDEAILEEESKTRGGEPLRGNVSFQAWRERPLQLAFRFSPGFQPVEPDTEPGERADAAPAQRPEPHAAAQADVLADPGRVGIDPGVEGDVRAPPHLRVQPELDADVAIGGIAVSTGFARRVDGAPAERDAHHLVRLDLLRREGKHEGAAEEYQAE